MPTKTIRRVEWERLPKPATNYYPDTKCSVEKSSLGYECFSSEGKLSGVNLLTEEKHE
jgi:hypothetical protein